MTFAEVVIYGSIFTVYYSLQLITSLVLIDGIRKRNPFKLIPFMAVTTVGVFINSFHIITNGSTGVFFAIIVALIDAYIIICIYSIYQKFRIEKVNAGENLQQDDVSYASMPECIVSNERRMTHMSIIQEK